MSYEELTRLFAAARETISQDSMGSGFSRGLLAFLSHHGMEALIALDELISSEVVNHVIASEALRWLGHMIDPPSREARRGLLERSLLSKSSFIRDGAVLGLAYIDDPRSIPALEQALEREEIATLRRDLELVLDQLRDTSGR